MKGKIKFKVIAGDPAIICSKCNKVVKYSKFFTQEEWEAYRNHIKLSPVICNECLEDEFDS